MCWWGIGSDWEGSGEWGIGGERGRGKGERGKGFVEIFVGLSKETDQGNLGEGFFKDFVDRSRKPIQAMVEVENPSPPRRIQQSPLAFRLSPFPLPLPPLPPFALPPSPPSPSPPLPSLRLCVSAFKKGCFPKPSFAPVLTDVFPKEFGRGRVGRIAGHEYQPGRCDPDPKRGCDPQLLPPKAGGR